MLYFDNNYTSLPLLKKLKAEQTLACGTIRSDRSGLLRTMIVSRVLKHGDYDYRFSFMDVGVWKWQVNKTVHLARNFHGSGETSLQRTQKDGSKLPITAPMDPVDRLRAVYGVDRRFIKRGLIDMTLLDAYIIYSEINDKLSLLEFRRSLAMGLITHKRLGTIEKCSVDMTYVTSNRKVWPWIFHSLRCSSFKPRGTLG
ncbi:hypothetical protein JTB14_032284 [Gonioctena quinquepunctata]|nr:hypothetical protein JTB14_032284 [Gonioctena quinquepunctata]